MYFADNNDNIVPSFANRNKGWSTYVSSYLVKSGEYSINATKFDATTGIMSQGVSKKTPEGVFFCPKASVQNPQFSGTAPTPVAYFPTYDIARRYVSNANLDKPSGKRVYLRSTAAGVMYNTRVANLMSDTIVMTETNFAKGTDGYYMPDQYKLEETNNYPAQGTYGPAWNHHGKRANFFFINGSVRTVRYSAGVFDTTENCLKE